LTTSKDPPSLNTIADLCDQAARYLHHAAATIRYADLVVARQKLTAARHILADIEKQQI